MKFKRNRRFSSSVVAAGAFAIGYFVGLFLLWLVGLGGLPFSHFTPLAIVTQLVTLGLFFGIGVITVRILGIPPRRLGWAIAFLVAVVALRGVVEATTNYASRPSQSWLEGFESASSTMGKTLVGLSIAFLALYQAVTHDVPPKP